MTQWKLVPVEPTDEMILANCYSDAPTFQTWLAEDARQTWTAMLNAAPQPDDTALLRQCLRALQDIYIAPEHLDYIADWWPACMEAIIALRDRLGEGK